MILTPSKWRARSVFNRLCIVGLSALMTVLLAACGASSASSGSTASTAGPQTGMTIRPCLGSYTGVSNPALTLTNASSNVSGSAHVGDTIEIHLDGHHKWSLSGAKPSDTLTVETTQGLLDGTNGTCVWVFRASAPGDAVVTYTGTALCDPTQACPQYAILQTFNIHIS